ncbi:flavoprotein [Sporomusa malonica]|uniref:Flavoprotein n=1 Tax=Sporomusa malonica TaxID=112901 RepID=A0A1W1YFV5_9FIRM|nr:flavoprotein [Sporomusa malonica]SMC34701.1 Flavoprotein [Sporomusa malonica]
MDNEKLVELVTAEVLRQLNLRAGSVSMQPDGPHYKALAIFTGGTIGLETSLEELRALQAINTELTVVLSEAAEKIIGINWIKEKLGSHVQVVTTQSPYPGKYLRAADIVLVPVLTQNTAAKLAYTLSDTMVSTLIFQALMLGKPVIAAQNAADPEDGWRIQKSMEKASPALKAALRGNLNKLETYGIQLAPVASLAEKAKKVLIPVIKPQAVQSPEKVSKRKVIDADTVRRAAQSGAAALSVPQGTIITPLARDIAKECNIEIIYS